MALPRAADHLAESPGAVHAGDLAAGDPDPRRCTHRLLRPLRDGADLDLDHAARPDGSDDARDDHAHAAHLLAIVSGDLHLRHDPRARPRPADARGVAAPRAAGHPARGQATQARLDALAARLEPHFLFNALQSVSALIDSDPVRARTMVAQIGDLLRDALAAPESGEVPLREELRLLGRYLSIEETRFADRLHVEWAIAPDTEAVMVPRFLLQPIVENALRHGLAVLPEGAACGSPPCASRTACASSSGTTASRSLRRCVREWASRRRGSDSRRATVPPPRSRCVPPPRAASRR
ncbi:MAG: histidine kinase [Gemmatimonadetes bacterium]|nr:histidine kinase [Gemmatimonadota bacterium]